MKSQELIALFNKKAFERDKWVRRNKYYNKKLLEFLKFHILPNSSILEIGCGTGFLLNSLSPKIGYGIDFSPEMIKIASKNYPHLTFLCADAHNYKLDKKFDYILISDTIGYFEDIQLVFKNLRKNCTSKTRIIITSYNYLWEPFLKFSEILHLKSYEPFTNWLSTKDIENLLVLENFDIIKTGEKILIPKYLPLISNFFNKYFSVLPLIRKLCLVHFIIFRPLNLEKRKEKSVSIIIPTRNEEGNIEKIITSLPNLGTKTELIFIEGGSNDNTWLKIQEMAKKYKTKNILYFKQDGKGKWNAVQKGFSLASNEILMIYDADMTVPSKDLIKFYNALVSNQGEFILGSRLIYPMEKEAMRSLNLFGNKMFSLMFSWLLDSRIKDTLCGTKVLSKENYLLLEKNQSYFGNFDPFGDFNLIFGASKLDLKIIEIPIHYQERTYGTTNIKRFSHGWLLIKMCLFAMKKLKFI